MRANRIPLPLGILAAVLTAVAVDVRAAEIRPVGVLENNPSKYSSCVAMSEDGQWVVGTSKKMDASLVLVDWPFRWSKTTGMLDMTNPSGGNSYVTGCATLWDGSMLACGNVGGMARKWYNGAWSILPGQGGSPRSVYCISRSESLQETWIGGSSYPAENEKAYRYQWSNNAYIDFWGYYQDVYGIAHNGWAVGKNNWGNAQENPDWRYNHPIFIFDWMYNCGAGGNCGWDQLNRFAGYGDDQYYKGQATAIAPSARWAVGYMTYNPADLNLYHAFKWQVPANPQLAPQPWLTWPRPIDLGALPGDQQSYAYCVSDHATTPVIGGKSYLSTRGEKAVYWDGTGIHDLYAELQARGVSMGHWSSLARVLGISANGQIMCGFGYYDDDNNPATPAIQMGFVVDFAATNQPPIIVQQPQAQNVCQGGTVQFFVDATGEGTLSYRWQKNQVNLDDAGHYSGSATQTLTIAGADGGDAANYRCVVTNAYGSTNSSEATLTVAAGIPAVPADGVPTTDAANRILWKWSDVAGEAGYRVRNTGGAAMSGDLAANATQWQEAGLAANTAYTRRIHAFNACGESAGSAGQTRYTLAAAPTYGTGTTSPTVYSDKGPSASELPAGSSVTFTATNGFGDGPDKVGQFGYLWNQTAGAPSGWTGEQYWTTGSLARQVGTSGSWYLHLRSYNNESPASPNATVLNLGPYTVVGSSVISCLQNAGFENGFTSGVGNNWTRYVYAGSVTCSDGTSQVHGGAHSQQVTVANSSNEGGVYQQFDTLAGATYTVKIWMKVSSSTNGYAYLGVDPYGGTNSHSGSIAWNGTNSTSWSAQTWTGQAMGARITVYLDMSSANSSSATGWFDDAEPMCSPPGAPADGTPQALSATSIRWKWSAASGASGYRVKDAGGINLSGDLAAATTQWDETTGILPNTQYTRRIYAFNPYGESGPSTGQSRHSLIQAPAGVSFGAVAPGAIEVSPTGSLSNLATGNSGVRTANVTAGTDSGWVQSQNAWTSTGLTANTQYVFVARARNAEGAETADSAPAAKWTLSTPPASDSVTPDNPTPHANAAVAWTAVGGFGPGTIQYYRYAWDQSATYTWTGSEPQWSSGTLSTTPTATGAWYLHVMGFNGEGVGNGTYDYTVTALPALAAADFDRDGDVDLTDFATFQYCFNGPNQPYRTGCEVSDFDRDGDVDLADFAAFQSCFNGPNQPPACR